MILIITVLFWAAEYVPTAWNGWWFAKRDNGKAFPRLFLHVNKD